MYLLNSATVTSASVTIGRISALKSVKIAPRPSPCGPSAGRIGNLIAKTRISRMPDQEGRASRRRSVENALKKWSVNLLRRTAWITPIGIATISARIVETPTSTTVLGSRLAEQRGDALVERPGVPEVALGEMTQPQEVLGVPREVEAVRRSNSLMAAGLAVNAGAHDRDGHVARDQPQQRERDHRHDEQHHDRLEHPADEEDCQLSPFRPSRERRGDPAPQARPH